MASEVSICNRALQKLGAKRITSLTEDAVNARACNVAYESLRDALLRMHPWVFAIARAALAADATAPDWGRANAFQLPSDYVRMLRPYPEDNANNIDWQVEGQKILTDDSDPIYLRYISRVTDPNLMDPLFREALAAYMAVELCEELTQSNTKKASLMTDFEKSIATAKRNNAFENVPAVAPDDDWLMARA